MQQGIASLTCIQRVLLMSFVFEARWTTEIGLLASVLCSLVHLASALAEHILRRILPEGSEIPTSFETIGTVGQCQSRLVLLQGRSR